MRQPFNLRQQAALMVLCDTFVPAVSPPAMQAGDPTGFWGRTASDIGVPRQLADQLARRLDDDELASLRSLLDLVAMSRFGHLPQGVRVAVLAGLGRTSDDAHDAIKGLRSLALFLYYAGVNEHGDNPVRAQTGHPPPPPTTSRATAPATAMIPASDDELVLDADVVVVGSGSGGGVVAGMLARAGRDVVVLEQGRAFDDAAFPRDEVGALTQLYWRGGLNLTADATVAILAGATLGGGSTINWQNCVRPPDLVREEWAAHGLADVATSAFDDHLDVVLARMQATDAHSEHNGPNAALARGADALGWSWHRAIRNVDGDAHDPDMAGWAGYGDRSGAKLGTLKTWLDDAVGAGARIVTRCHVDRVATRHGRATGVTGVVADHDGIERPVTVHARHVVVAGGALETPAILLRSGLGGPSVGRFLRLHPVPAIVGVYDEPMDGWWGPPQSTVVDEHRDVVHGHGYLVECIHDHPGVVAMSMPWRNGRDHKLIMGRSRLMAGFIAVQRDHGSGRVRIDDRGRAKVTHPVDDPVDLQVMRHALSSLARAHAAAGARMLLDMAAPRTTWQRGQDLDAFIAVAQGVAVGRRGRVLFSAHQMGSARLGNHPVDSVATPDGHLHEVDNVWIGDTSGFPNAVGVNPMVTCMAMARRTTERILAAT